MSSFTAADSSLGVSFSGALQASISVLLTLFLGFLAARFGMINPKTSKEISALCMKIFLPCLLITTIGKEIGRPEHKDQKHLYGDFILWALFYSLLSIALGYVTQRILKLPTYTTPAIAFNNTTSLPLLLVQSLQATGFLDSLITEGSSASAVSRAQAFFLINSMVNKSMVLSIGPKLIFDVEDPNDVETPAREDDGESESNGEGTRRRRRKGRGRRGSTVEDVMIEHPAAYHSSSSSSPSSSEERGPQASADETTSLLPQPIIDGLSNAQETVTDVADRTLKKLPKPARATITATTFLINPALIAAFVALIIGLSDNLHAAFFEKPADGGIFTGWLTSALDTLGGLFTGLQMFIVGTSLSTAAESVVAKRRNSSTNGNGNGNGHRNGSSTAEQEQEQREEVSLIAVLVIFLYRFVLWTLVSCSIVYLLAAKLQVLGKDPVAWFTMILMPIGPPAMMLVPLIDVTRKPGDRDPKIAVSKMLAIMYALTPMICFPVVAALKLSEKIKRDMDL